MFLIDTLVIELMNRVVTADNPIALDNIALNR